MSSTIFSGQKIKTLKDTLSLNDGADIISSTTDPTSSAVSANKGSILLNTSTGKVFKKTDNGSSTNWSELATGTGSSLVYLNAGGSVSVLSYSTVNPITGVAYSSGITTSGSPGLAINFPSNGLYSIHMQTFINSVSTHEPTELYEDPVTIAGTQPFDITLSDDVSGFYRFGGGIIGYDGTSQNSGYTLSHSMILNILGSPNGNPIQNPYYFQLFNATDSDIDINTWLQIVKIG